MRDYNDNAASCFARGWARVCARVAPKGRSSFSGKVFPTQMRHRTGLFISTATSCSCAPIQKGWTTGCRVNVISRCVFVPGPLGFTSMPIRGTLVVNPFLDEISCKAWFRAENDRRPYRRVRRTDFRGAAGIFITFSFRVENCSHRENRTRRKINEK